MEDQSRTSSGQEEQNINQPYSLVSANASDSDSSVTNTSPHQPVAGYASPEQPERAPKKSKSYLLYVFILLCVLVISGVLYSVYSWQHRQLNHSKAKVSSLEAKINYINSNSGTFTYAPAHGNFSLTLPRSYGIVKIDDGCPCDNPYTDINIFPRTSNSIFDGSTNHDAYVYVLNSYNGVLNDALNNEEKNITSKGYKLISVADVKVDNISAKYLTFNYDAADNPVGGAYTQEYILGIGKWEDGIIIYGTKADILKADILKGIVISNTANLSSYNLQQTNSTFSPSFYKDIRKFFIPKN